MGRKKKVKIMESGEPVLSVHPTSPPANHYTVRVRDEESGRTLAHFGSFINRDEALRIAIASIKVTHGTQLMRNDATFRIDYTPENTTWCERDEFLAMVTITHFHGTNEESVDQYEIAELRVKYNPDHL